MFQILEKVFIIAEAGTAHADPDPSKRLKNAIRYARCAQGAGADAVKFQMFVDPLRDMFCWIDGDEARSGRWLDSALTLDEWKAVKNETNLLGIKLFASVFQHKTIQWIKELKLEVTKVASRAANTFPYGSGPTPYLVSNGMFPVPDREDIIEFQCEANYPSTQWWDGVSTGFSDHSGTPERAIAAIRRGCKLIEVHFYDSPEDAGPDLPACLTLNELALVSRERR